MSITQARIVSIETRAIRVSVAEQSACGGCRSKSACGVGTVREIPVDNQTLESLRIGDQVELKLPTSITLGLAALLYLPPALGFLLGMAFSSLISDNEAITLAGGVIGLALGFTLTWVINRFKRSKNGWAIEVINRSNNTYQAD